MSESVNLLALDGGGVRGVSELLILHEIMKRLQHDKRLENLPPPSDYFHLIGGTSTGGLIAIMLGRLKMTTQQALQAYHSLAEEIFSRKNRKSLIGHAYKASTLETKVRKVVKSFAKDGDRMLPKPDNGGLGKAFVCAMPEADMSHARLFRSYPVRNNASANCMIWEAARATTAAPRIFKGIAIGEEGQAEERFLDGGLRCNNPVWQVIEEAGHLFDDGARLGCLVSIGTGHPGVIGLGKPDFLSRAIPLQLIDVLKRIATDCEQTHHQLAQHFHHSPNCYFRFNLPHGAEAIGLDEWEKMSQLTSHTQAYIQDESACAAIDTIVHILTRSNESPVTNVTLGSIRRGPSAFLQASSVSPNREEASNMRKAFLQWLGKLDFQAVLEKCSNERVPSTCAWFLNHPQFVAWEASATSSLLQCIGKRGSGKTILASAAVDHIQQNYSQSPNKAVAFAFCDSLDEMSSDPENILSAVAKQICSRLKDIPPTIRDLHNKATELRDRPTREELKNVIKMASKSFCEVYIIIDALDECKGYEELCDYLQDLGTSQDTVFKILVFSRSSNHDITAIFGDSPAIKLTPEIVQTDIHAFVIARLELFIRRRRLVINNQTLKDEIVSSLCHQSNGMFLWVHFQLLSLCQQHSEMLIRQALKELPKDLDEVYERAICDISKQKSPLTVSLAQQVLKWIYFAKRPLLTAELAEALIIDPEKTTIDRSALILDPYMLESCCANLVLIDGSVITFIHSSVKDYLRLRLCKASESPNRALKPLLNGEIDVAAKCLSYLLLDDFQGPLPQNFGRILDRVKTHPFISYASQCWSDHANDAMDHDSNTAARVLRFLKSQSAIDSARQVNLGSEARPIPEKLDILQLIATYRLEHLVEFIEISAEQTRVEDDRGFTPIMIAVSSGSSAIIDRLLRKGALLDHICKRGYNSLTIATIMQNLDLVRKLLEKGADHSPENVNSPPVVLAASFGYLEILNQLISAGAVLDAVDNSGLTALNGAVLQNQTHIVKRLCESDVDLNRPTNAGQSPLLIAAYHGNLEILQMLLNAGASINPPQMSMSSALYAAVKREHINVIRQLLDFGADPNYVNGPQEDTCLMLAVYLDCDEIVRLLLSFGADISYTNSDGLSALVVACGQGRPGIAKVLWEHVAGREEASFQGDIIEMLTVIRRGDTAMCRLLLEYSYDAKATTPDKNSLLDEAVIWGRVDIAKLLQENGAIFSAIVNRKPGISLLHMHIDVLARVYQETEAEVLRPILLEDSLNSIKLMVDAGADVNVPDEERNGLTPLHDLVSTHQPFPGPLIQLLVGLGADLNKKDSDGNTALDLAASFGSKESVTALLDAGAVMDFQSTKGCKGLAAAALGGKEDAFKILFERQGNMTDGSGCILACAVAGGNLAIIQACHDAGEAFEPGALATAASYSMSQVVEYLIECGFDVNSIGEAWDRGVSAPTCSLTALHAAARAGDEKIVQRLLEAGANVDLAVETLGPSIFAAIQGQRCSVLQRILDANADTSCRNPDGYTSLQVAASRGNVAMCEMIVHKSHDILDLPSPGGSALEIAISERKKEVVIRLVELGANINVSNQQNRPIFEEISETGDLDLITLFLQHPELHGSRLENVSAAFVYATMSGEIDCLCALLSLGANPNYTVKNGFNALHMAAFSSKEFLPSTQFLLDLGVDLDASDNFSWTPLTLSIVARNDQLALKLLQAGASPEKCNVAGASALHIAIVHDRPDVARALLEHGAEVNFQMKDTGITPLHKAAFRRSHYIINLLLSYGADPWLLDNFGRDLKDLASIMHFSLPHLNGQSWSDLIKTRTLVQTIVTGSSDMDFKSAMQNAQSAYLRNALRIAGDSLNAAFLIEICAERDETGILKYAFHACDGCDINPITGTMYMCKSCPDVDLCQNCFAVESEGNLHLPCCQGHAFLSIPHPDDGNLWRYFRTDRQAWWESLRARYQEELARINGWVEFSSISESFL